MSLNMVRDKISSIVSLSRGTKYRGIVTFIILLMLTRIYSLLYNDFMLLSGSFKYSSREAKYGGSIIVIIIFILLCIWYIPDNCSILPCGSIKSLSSESKDRGRVIINIPLLSSLPNSYFIFYLEQLFPYPWGSRTVEA